MLRGLLKFAVGCVAVVVGYALKRIGQDMQGNTEPSVKRSEPNRPPLQYEAPVVYATLDELFTQLRLDDEIEDALWSKTPDDERWN